MSKKIFISHAVKDKEIADAFVDIILHGALSVPISEIFCVSTDGTKIKSGEDWRNSIKTNIRGAKINFLLISPNYKKSEVCLNEMGAAWMTNARVLPLIIEPINYKTVGILQEPNQIEKLLDEKSLDRIKDIVQEELEIENSLIKSDRWTTKKKEFQQRIKEYLTNNPFEHIERNTFEQVERNNVSFISGLTSSNIYSKEEAEKGSEYYYSNGRKFKINFFYCQSDLVFYAINENNEKQLLTTTFEVGYSYTDKNYFHLKDKTRFLVGQYDFNGDGIDELIIAIQDYDEGDNGLSINVYQLKKDSWEQIGVLTGQTILGEPKAEIRINKITIHRNLRGFYYQWTFESGKFKDTGDH